MDKIDKLLQCARKLPPKLPVDLSIATTEELKELIDANISDKRFDEIIEGLMHRNSKMVR